MAKKAPPAFFSYAKYISEVFLLVPMAGSYQLALAIFITTCRSCTDQPNKCSDRAKSDTDPSNYADLAYASSRYLCYPTSWLLTSKHLHLGTLQLDAVFLRSMYYYYSMLSRTVPPEPAISISVLPVSTAASYTSARNTLV